MKEIDPGDDILEKGGAGQNDQYSKQAADDQGRKTQE
jgi:hypothetical protein